jgi:MarR family transcriptional regulator, temperature-dependent positive regulator of motility
MLTDEMRYKLMRVLENNPAASQRELARELGVSLGRVNYCLRALISHGFIKAKNFHKSDNKIAYRYLLTASGLEQKANLTLNFLKTKTQEYEALRLEIEGLRRELER